MRRATRLVRQIVKIPALLGLLAAHAVLMLATVGLTRPRRPFPASETLTVVVPFEPGDASGGAKAVKDFVVMLGPLSPTVVCVPNHQERTVRSRIASALSWPLPIPRQCGGLLLGDSRLDTVTTTGTVVFECMATALIWAYRRPRAAYVVLREQEVLTRKLWMEVQRTTGVTRIVQMLSLAVCYLVSISVYRRMDFIVTLTEQDRDWIERRFPWMRDRVQSLPAPFVEPPEPKVSRSPLVPARDLLMVANFFHTPNVDALRWFARECAPHLDAGFTLHVFGLDAPLDDLDIGSSPVRIVRHGFVDDPIATVPTAAIALAPVVSGGGVRIKNLFLASMRRVVVTTPLGNEGIGFVDGRDALICDDGRVMAARINAVARTPDEIVRLGESARAFVRANFGHAAIFDRFQREVLQVAPDTKGDSLSTQSRVM